MQRRITKTVWLLSLVSLFTDIASEMLYPVMPVYLSSIGFSVLTIGILEGIAEAIAGLSKPYFGKWSDNVGKRLPFIQLGYAISAISKPLMGLFTHVSAIFIFRTMDRFGKGMRTGARDAMLSNEAVVSNIGSVFGFHRSMDTLGAVVGPLMALLFLFFFPSKYQWLFWLAIVPGAIAILFTFVIKERKTSTVDSKRGNIFFASFKYWKHSNRNYKKVVILLIIFALFNSSDMLLLLKIKKSGYNDTWVIGAYIFYNLIYALASYPMGLLADKTGMQKIISLGFLFFSITYFGFAWNNNLAIFIILFFVYGLFAAATEGVAKAWISSMVNPNDTGVALGMFAGLQSISLMIASAVAGLVWFTFGAAYSFLISAIVSLSVAVVLLFFVQIKSEKNG